MTPSVFPELFTIGDNAEDKSVNLRSKVLLEHFGNNNVNYLIPDFSIQKKDETKHIAIMVFDNQLLEPSTNLRI